MGVDLGISMPLGFGVRPDDALTLQGREASVPP
jgi:hypothetical protein